MGNFHAYQAVPTKTPEGKDLPPSDSVNITIDEGKTSVKPAQILPSVMTFEFQGNKHTIQTINIGNFNELLLAIKHKFNLNSNNITIWKKEPYGDETWIQVKRLSECVSLSHLMIRVY